MDLVVDHLVTVWSGLEAPTETLADLGLPPTYGGTHGDGTTEMSTVCFRDGSYLELITGVPGRDPSRWPDGIAADAGPFDWAVQVGDVAAHLQAAMSRGEFVAGPRHESRERPDGRLVEWDRGEYGDEGRRSLLPMVIADRTPRRYRASVAEAVEDAPVSGVGEVVLAVPDLDRAVEAFVDLHRFPAPERAAVGDGVKLASFAGEPATLVSSAGGSDAGGGDAGDGGDADDPTPDSDGDGGRSRGLDADWVAGRLDQFDPRPCGCLLRVRTMGAARRAYDLTDPVDWPYGRVAWFDDDRVGRWLGVIERERPG